MGKFSDVILKIRMVVNDAVKWIQGKEDMEKALHSILDAMQELEFRITIVEKKISSTKSEPDENPQLKIDSEPTSEIQQEIPEQEIKVEMPEVIPDQIESNDVGESEMPEVPGGPK